MLSSSYLNVEPMELMELMVDRLSDLMRESDTRALYLD
jgi:hypothetical protein